MDRIQAIRVHSKTTALKVGFPRKCFCGDTGTIAPTSIRRRWMPKHTQVLHVALDDLLPPTNFCKQVFAIGLVGFCLVHRIVNPRTPDLTGAAEIPTPDEDEGGAILVLSAAQSSLDEKLTRI